MIYSEQVNLTCRFRGPVIKYPSNHQSHMHQSHNIKIIDFFFKKAYRSFPLSIHMLSLLKYSQNKAESKPNTETHADSGPTLHRFIKECRTLSCSRPLSQGMEPPIYTHTRTRPKPNTPRQPGFRKSRLNPQYPHTGGSHTAKRLALKASSVN